MTPQERAFVEAVRRDARTRVNVADEHSPESVTARDLWRAADALLAAPEATEAARGVIELTGNGHGQYPDVTNMTPPRQLANDEVLICELVPVDSRPAAPEPEGAADLDRHDANVARDMLEGAASQNMQIADSAISDSMPEQLAISTPAPARRDSLSQEARDAIEVSREMLAKRRDVDRGLPSLADMRDALFCAASNLECAPPEQQPDIAARLRVVADELAELWARAGQLTAARVVSNLADKLKRDREAPARRDEELDRLLDEYRTDVINAVRMDTADDRRFWNSASDDRDAIVAHVARRVAEARSMCGVCAGTGKPVSGKPCVCEGIGTQDAEVIGLRKELFRLQREEEAEGVTVAEGEIIGRHIPGDNPAFMASWVTVRLDKPADLWLGNRVRLVRAADRDGAPSQYFTTPEAMEDARRRAAQPGEVGP